MATSVIKWLADHAAAVPTPVAAAGGAAATAIPLDPDAVEVPVKAPSIARALLRLREAFRKAEERVDAAKLRLQKSAGASRGSSLLSRLHGPGGSGGGGGAYSMLGGALGLGFNALTSAKPDQPARPAGSVVPEKKDEQEKPDAAAQAKAGNDETAAEKALDSIADDAKRAEETVSRGADRVDEALSESEDKAQKQRDGAKADQGSPWAEMKSRAYASVSGFLFRVKGLVKSWFDAIMSALGLGAPASGGADSGPGVGGMTPGGGASGGATPGSGVTAGAAGTGSGAGATPGSATGRGGGTPGRVDTSPAPEGSTALKNLIAQHETGTQGPAGYDTVYGHGKYLQPPKPITQMTLSEILEYQAQGKRVAGSPAYPVGRPQIVQSTLEGLIREMGLDPKKEKFTPELQERMFDRLLERRKNQGIDGLRKEWDSLRHVPASEIERARNTPNPPKAAPAPAPGGSPAPDSGSPPDLSKGGGRPGGAAPTSGQPEQQPSAQQPDATPAPSSKPAPEAPSAAAPSATPAAPTAVEPSPLPKDEAPAPAPAAPSDGGRAPRDGEPPADQESFDEAALDDGMEHGLDQNDGGIAVVRLSEYA